MLIKTRWQPLSSFPHLLGSVNRFQVPQVKVSVKTTGAVNTSSPAWHFNLILQLIPAGLGWSLLSIFHCMVIDWNQFVQQCSLVSIGCPPLNLCIAQAHLQGTDWLIHAFEKCVVLIQSLVKSTNTNTGLDTRCFCTVQVWVDFLYVLTRETLQHTSTLKPRD